jgi:hypothetical protein
MTDESAPAKKRLPGVTERAYATSVKAAGLGPESAVTIALGRRIAQLIDAARGTDGEAKTLIMLGGELQNVLTRLGVNAGRPDAADAADDAPPVPVSRTDELRRKRAQRQAAGA